MFYQHCLRPSVEPDKEPEVDAVEYDSEIMLNRVEEEMLAAYSDGSDDENVFHVQDLMNTNTLLMNEIDFKGKGDEGAWHLELERVLPLLKVFILYILIVLLPSEC